MAAAPETTSSLDHTWTKGQTLGSGRGKERLRWSITTVAFFGKSQNLRFLPTENSKKTLFPMKIWQKMWFLQF